VVAAILLMIGNTASAAIVPTVPLATAANDAAPAGQTVTNTGPSILNGSLGLSPGTSITGFPPGIVVPPGRIDQTNGAAQLAKSDLTAAYLNAAGRLVTNTTTSNLANKKLGAGTADGTTCTTLNCESFATDVCNHGDIARDINTSWMGFVGPGIRNLGTDSTTWASETDTRPTLLALLGLTDDYTHQGRVLTDIVDPTSLPAPVSSPNYDKLARMYTSLESPVGPFALATLAASTEGLTSGSAANDATYQRIERRIGEFGSRRDDLGYAIIRLLEGAAFGGQSIPPGMAAQLLHQGQVLLAQAEAFGRSQP
jgi:Ice-binding-like